MIQLTAAGSNQGNTNNTTHVEIVPAPGAGVIRVVTSIRFTNLDTAVVDLTVYKEAVTTEYAVAEYQSFPAASSWEAIIRNGILLTATTQRLLAALGGAVAANQPSFVVSYYDFTIS